MRPLSQLAASPRAAVTCALITEPCPRLQLLFLCLCRIPALCIMYHGLLTNWQQLHFCLSCSATCGGYEYARVQVAGNVGVSPFLLDSHLTLPTGLGIFCSHVFTHLSLSVSATCSIHNVQELFFLLYVHFVRYHFSRQDHPLGLKLLRERHQINSRAFCFVIPNPWSPGWRIGIGENIDNRCAGVLIYPLLYARWHIIFQSQ